MMSIYLVAAYAVFWACTFALILLLWARQRRIERDLRRLERQMDKDPPGPKPTLSQAQ